MQEFSYTVTRVVAMGGGKRKSLTQRLGGEETLWRTRYINAIYGSAQPCFYGKNTGLRLFFKIMLAKKPNLIYNYFLGANLLKSMLQ